MRKLALLVVSFLTLIFTLPALPTNVHAEGEFQTDYKVSYAVDQTGKTNVAQEITLKNKTVNVYADRFELKIGSTKVENVKASDSTGPMETEVKFENNVTAIAVKFNQRVIGMDKTLAWNLTYTSNELASKSGQIWEISIPKVADSQDIGTYDATVTVPASFGDIAFSAPDPKETTTSRGGIEFKFNKDQLTKSGIAMSFGEKQIFSFTLNYYLKNNNLTTQIQEIALPPDNNYQRIVLENIDPKPMTVVVDDDGNFLARYRLTPKQELNVAATGAVEVFSKPFRNIYRQLTPEEKIIYTQTQKYWETDNAFVIDKAKELKTPEEIYKFVSTYLSYSNNRLAHQPIQRMGAALAVTDPQNAICMEFTDLFIAIARSAGIPAREVEGFAHTQNERLRPISLALTDGDILHAWPEYWDDTKGWVQVDPTWGSTSGGLDYFNKLDFNHITFVQRGASSTSPYPAGSHKKPSDTGKKSVFVNFAEELPQPSQSSEVRLMMPDKVIAGVPVRAIAQIVNTGQVSVMGEEVRLETNLTKSASYNSKIYILPPFAKSDATYDLIARGFLTRDTRQISVMFAGNTVTKEVQVVPIYYVFLSRGFLISATTTLGVIVLGFVLYRRLHRYRKPPSLESL
ncbi:MAG: transglutaminase domain-containing protein [Candidatus Curtissbacteria bacterium]|nr:transglutaminase domain-containing protein [Candidatus Curtissbacteria bacterium]